MRRFRLLFAGSVAVLTIAGCAGGGNESATKTTPATTAEVSRQASDAQGRTERLLFLTPGGTLASVRPDGTDLKTISRLGGGYAELSPDRRLLAVSYEDGRLTVRNIDSGKRRVVARDAGSWTWAPDSRRIAYRAGSGGVEQIYVVRVDGTQRRQISHNTRPTSGKYFNPYHLLAWSPDGARIAFANWQDYCGHCPYSGGRLLTISPGTGKETFGPRLMRFRRPGPSTGWGFVPYTLAWSPDGRTLAVASEAEYGVLLVRGTRVVFLRGSECCIAPQYLAWSPDGSRLAYLGADVTMADTGGVSALDGSVARVIPSKSMERFTVTPVWSPDGRQFAFLDCPYDGRCALYTSDRDGRDVRRVENSASIDSLLAWMR